MSRIKSLITVAILSGLSLTFQACGKAEQKASDPVSSTTAPVTLNAEVSKILEGATVLHEASFIGESDHTVSGTVKILKKGDLHYLKLADDFSFDGAPDPRLGFSKGDQFSQESLFSSLNLDSGKQLYRLPATLDISNFDEVTIWCKKFEVPLAEAKWYSSTSKP